MRDTVATSLTNLAQAQLPLDEAHRGAVIYAGISAAQVRAAFAKYIRPTGFASVVQGPTPR